MTAHRVIVHPAQATALLRTSGGDRPIVLARAVSYAALMAGRQWDPERSARPIELVRGRGSAPARLVNGQHRLLAVILAEQPVELLVELHEAGGGVDGPSYPPSRGEGVTTGPYFTAEDLATLREEAARQGEALRTGRGALAPGEGAGATGGEGTVAGEARDREPDPAASARSSMHVWEPLMHGSMSNDTESHGYRWQPGDRAGWVAAFGAPRAFTGTIYRNDSPVWLCAHRHTARDPDARSRSRALRQ